MSKKNEGGGAPFKGKRKSLKDEEEQAPKKVAQKQYRKECSSDGCTNVVIQGGVCKRHGAKAKLCSSDGCTNYAQQGRVCIRHGANRSWGIYYFDHLFIEFLCQTFVYLFRVQLIPVKKRIGILYFSLLRRISLLLLSLHLIITLLSTRIFICLIFILSLLVFFSSHPTPTLHRILLIEYLLILVHYLCFADTVLLWIVLVPFAPALYHLSWIFFCWAAKLLGIILLNFPIPSRHHLKKQMVSFRFRSKRSAIELASPLTILLICIQYPISNITTPLNSDDE